MMQFKSLFYMCMLRHGGQENIKSVLFTELCHHASAGGGTSLCTMKALQFSTHNNLQSEPKCFGQHKLPSEKSVCFMFRTKTSERPCDTAQAKGSQKHTVFMMCLFLKNNVWL